jgi:hypothetical protein
MSEPERQPIKDLLAEATDVLRTVDVTDTAAVLTAAWRGFCVAGAAGAVLSYCADPQTYPALWTNAEPVLQQTIVTLRTAPSLPIGLPTEKLGAVLGQEREDATGRDQIPDDLAGVEQLPIHPRISLHTSIFPHGSRDTPRHAVPTRRKPPPPGKTGYSAAS